MQFDSAVLKSVKADLDKKEITISFVVGLEDLPTAEELTNFMGPDRQSVKVDIQSRQLPLFHKEKP